MSLSRLFIDWLHLFFAAAWIGAAVQLARLTARRENLGPAWPEIVSSLRFASNYLLVAATVMVVTGLFKLKMIMDTEPGVFRSAYGQALLIKIFLALGMFGLALWNHLVVFARMSAATARGDWQKVASLERASSRFFKIIVLGSIALLLVVAALAQL